jgi:serine/threonine protein kinase
MKSGGGGSSNHSREFNLSIEKNLNEVNSSLNNPTFSFGNLDETLTIGIGTALYRAPEQESAPIDSSSSTSLPYTQKADMYSLGIILFEMCHPKFSTGMERLIIIKKLREKQEFPSNFQASISKELFKIIKWLIQYDPKERPSANELLLSDLMPSKVSVFIFLCGFGIYSLSLSLPFCVCLISWLLLSISCCFAGFLVSVLSSSAS